MGFAKDIPVAKAKDAVIEAVAAGVTVERALEAVDRGYKAYEGWRARDPEFARRVDEARAARSQARARGVSAEGQVRQNMGFAEWRKAYLNFDTYPHQQQWIDVLEGVDPTPMLGCDWKPSNPKRIIVNVPPGHSKSQTITVDYATYKICMNPNIRILIVSKRQEMARKFLHQIKQRLTSSLFAKLQAAFAPEGGFKPDKGEGSFAQNLIYINGRDKDSKDPTVEVLGMGSQIYGARADLIILDDCIVLANAHEYEKQIEWLTSEVESRVKGGTILVVGTRLKPLDMYSELLNPDRYLSGRTPWSYLRQPMVLRFADDPKDWLTLWPRSSTPYDEADNEPDENGTYAMFDGPQAAKIRESRSAQVWSMVYQQMTMSDDATFKPVNVFGSVDRRRKPGPLTAGGLGHPAGGGDGLWTIASMDPAMAGDTFVLVGKVDRVNKRRWIENAWVQTQPSPTWIRETIKSITETFRVNEWVIESNAFQLFLTQDPEITSYLQNRGIRLIPHHTSKNKADPDFGVASLEPLFGTFHRTNDGAGREVHNGNNLIELPDPEYSAGIKALLEQLFTWEPGKRGKDLKMDGPMALWFFELRARILLNHGVGDDSGEGQDFVRLPHMNRRSSMRQTRRPTGVPFGGRRVVTSG